MPTKLPVWPGKFAACKLYPAGATTNSDSGVTDIRRVDWEELNANANLFGNLSFNGTATAVPGVAASGHPYADFLFGVPVVWTVRDGRNVRFRVFKTRAEALEVAGSGS